MANECFRDNVRSATTATRLLRCSCALVCKVHHDLDRARLLGCADHASYIGLGYLGGAAWHLSLSLCDLADCGGHHAAARDDGLA